MRSLSATVAISAALLGAAAGTARATTLQQLSIDTMIQLSSSIVHVKVTGFAAGFVGNDVYTTYTLQVIETLKASATQQSQVAVPGGAARGIRQMVAGAPVLASGQEYVIFLWTSKSGLTQIIGLSQGLFAVTQDSSGNAVLARAASTGLLLNQSGQPASDLPVTMSLSALKTEIQSVLGSSN